MCEEVSGNISDWLANNISVRHGDPFSPTLFNLYINDIVVDMKEMNIGVMFAEEVFNMLVFADDMV